MDSLKLTKGFYKKFKTEGLSKLMTKQRNNKYLRFLKSHLQKNHSILDLACGYGRLTIPLAKTGYRIEGIDLSPNLIKDAKAQAKAENLKVSFKVGNMLELPYKNDSFDAVICMWSSFNHLLKEEEQIKSLNEMMRVLRKDGFAIIDMPSNKVINGQHLVPGNMDGYEFVDFIHNKESLLRIIKKSKITNFKIKTEEIGERKRLALFIYK